MLNENDLKEMSTEELIKLYEEYNSTPSKPVASFMAKLIRAELENRGETVK